MDDARALCIFPIAGMVGYQNGPRWVEIGDVRFVSWITLAGTWAELGFPSDPTEHLRGAPWQIELEASDVVGIVRYAGPAKEAVDAPADKVVRALKMLLACNAPWGPGGVRQRPIAGAIAKRSSGFVYAQDIAAQSRPWIKGISFGPSHEIKLDGFWEQNRKSAFYDELNELLSGSKIVEDDWKVRLLDSAELLGHSRLASTRWEAFLFAMIGMERLLKRDQRQRWRDGVADNVRSLFSWLGSGKGNQYVEDVEALYVLRNDVAHEGKIDAVTVRSVKIADEVLFNLLLVSFKHLDEIRSLDGLTARGLAVQVQIANGEIPTVLPNAIAIYDAFDR